MRIWRSPDGEVSFMAQASLSGESITDTDQSPENSEDVASSPCFICFRVSGSAMRKETMLKLMYRVCSRRLAERQKRCADGHPQAYQIHQNVHDNHAQLPTGTHSPRGSATEKGASKNRTKLNFTI